MPISDFFSRLTGRRSERKYAKMMNGYIPIFSQFGNDIYASDVVQRCIDIIASECGKLQPQHVVIGEDLSRKVPNSSLNRLFEFGPNPLMTTRDFIEKVIWTLYLDYNCFIYPIYEGSESDGNGQPLRRKYTALYPLKPNQVTFLTGQANELWIEMRFGNGQVATLPYSDVIHLRKKFGVNEFMGGGIDGRPDNAPLLKALLANHEVLEGIPKAIKTSMSVRLAVRVAAPMDTEEAREERKRFEQLIREGDSGVLPIGLEVKDLVPVTIDPKVVDKDTLQFLQDKILNWFGVSVPIYTGKSTDEDRIAFHDSIIESIITSFNQAFTKTLFTPRMLDVGNRIFFTQKDFMNMSLTSKISLLKTAGEQGLLSDDEKRGMFGLPPIPGGNRRTQSLNFVDTSIINAYQLGRMKSNTKDNEEGSEEQENGDKTKK